jgi:uncharacterized protein (UPF0332 family)
MSLDNLVGESLERIEPEPEAIRRLVSSAERNISDANIAELSTENRFDVAYKAIMQLANAALQSSGYRTLTSVPGHHMTMVQSLRKTVGVSREMVIVLDALRKQRNLNDYSGAIVPESAAEECIASAQSLLEQVKEWLSTTKPGLLE